MLAPGWALYPLVVLATAAAVIASQALISGSYSITLQAIQLGYLPRVSIRHTSAHTAGQIYIGIVNWILLAACLGLVKGFGSSSALASAYGIAVTLTMMVTTIVFFFVARDLWGWHPLKLIPPVALVFGMEFAFFSANAVKILDGGWFPVAVGAGLFIVMTTWRTGRALVGRDQDQMAMTQEMFLESLAHSPHLTRVPGTAIFMSGNRGKTPTSLLHNLKHNKVLHERVVFLTILTAEQPFVPREKQVELEELKPNIFRMTGHYGFMQDPNVPQLLRRARAQYGFECDADDVTFFLGRETIVPSHDHAMAGWREHLFAFLSRLAQTPAHYFRLPENRVVELGVRVKI